MENPVQFIKFSVKPKWITHLKKFIIITLYFKNKKNG